MKGPPGMSVKELSSESWPAWRKRYRPPSAEAKPDKKKKHPTLEVWRILGPAPARPYVM